MKHILILVSFLFSLQAFSGGRDSLLKVQDLLQAPQKYDGMIVEVVGIVRIEFEGNSLYPDKTTYSKRSTEKGLWLEIAKTTFENPKNNGTHVVIKGKFNHANKGHLGAWKGALENVTKLEVKK